MLTLNPELGDANLRLNGEPFGQALGYTSRPASIPSPSRRRRANGRAGNHFFVGAGAPLSRRFGGRLRKLT